MKKPFANMLKRFSEDKVFSDSCTSEEILTLTTLTYVGYCTATEVKYPKTGVYFYTTYIITTLGCYANTTIATKAHAEYCAWDLLACGQISSVTI